MSMRTRQVRGLSLCEVLPEAVVIGADDIRVTSCCGEPHACRPGDLFVLPPQLDHDPQALVHKAIERGAAAVLAETPVRIAPLPVAYVPHVRQAFGQMCQALANHPSQRLHVVGIAGTAGVADTARLVTSIFQAAGINGGHVDSHIDSTTAIRGGVSPNTPCAPQLARSLAEMVAADCSHAVVEISGQALAEERSAGIEFDVACITSFRHDRGTNRRDFQQACADLCRWMGQLRAEGMAILNSDDEICRDWLGRCAGPVLTVGSGPEAEITAVALEEYSSEQTFLLHVDDESIPVHTRVAGQPHRRCCLAAAAVGLTYGIDLATVVRGIEAADAAPKRREPAALPREHEFNDLEPETL